MTDASPDSERFRILVDPTSFSRSGRGQIAGTIYASLDDHPFPEAYWSDLVVAVLHGWISDLVGFCRANGDTVRLHFMDGPYALELRRQQSDQYGVACIRLPDATEFVREGLSFHDVIDAFTAAAATVADECDCRGWTSRDIVELRLAQRALSDCSAGR